MCVSTHCSTYFYRKWPWMQQHNSHGDKGRGAKDKFYRNENAKRAISTQKQFFIQGQGGKYLFICEQNCPREAHADDCSDLDSVRQVFIIYQRPSVSISPHHDLIDLKNMSTPRYLLSTPPEQYDSHWFPQYLQCQPCHVCNGLTQTFLVIRSGAIFVHRKSGDFS